MIYCLVSRYAETAQQNCLTKHNWKRKLKLQSKLYKSKMSFKSTTNVVKQSLQMFDSFPLKALCT